MRQATGYALFDTAVGVCAGAWGSQGIVGLRLPDRDADDTRARLKHRWPQAEEGAPPPAVQRAIDDIVRLMHGERPDLMDVPLDMHDIPEFNRRVYDIARRIAPGRTLTYVHIAEALGDLSLSRAVGQALGRNPFPIVVPCHRVLAAHAGSGGFSAPGGVATKLKLLTIERAQLSDQPDLFA